MPYRHPHLTSWSLYKPVINKGQLFQTIGPCDHADRDAICIICHGEIDARQSTLTHSTCLHPAHEQCLNPWLIQQYANNGVGECPLCRQPYSFYEALERLKAATSATQRPAVEGILKRVKDQILEIGEAVLLESPEMFLLDDMASKFFASDAKYAETIYATLRRKNEMVQTATEEELEKGASWEHASHWMETYIGRAVDNIEVELGLDREKLETALEKFYNGPEVVQRFRGLEKIEAEPTPVETDRDRLLEFINKLLELCQEAAQYQYTVYRGRRTEQLISERRVYHRRTGILFPHETTPVQPQPR